MSWVPITPSGSVLMHLQKDTEDNAWAALVKYAGYMGYPDKDAFLAQGYSIHELIDVDEIKKEEK